MESIRISIIQTDIVWENKQENRFTGDVFHRIQHAE